MTRNVENRRWRRRPFITQITAERITAYTLTNTHRRWRQSTKEKPHTRRKKKRNTYKSDLFEEFADSWRLRILSQSLTNYIHTWNTISIRWGTKAPTISIEFCYIPHSIRMCEFCVLIIILCCFWKMHLCAVHVVRAKAALSLRVRPVWVC